MVALFEILLLFFVGNAVKQYLLTQVKNARDHSVSSPNFKIGSYLKNYLQSCCFTMKFRSTRAKILPNVTQLGSNKA